MRVKMVTVLKMIHSNFNVESVIDARIKGSKVLWFDGDESVRVQLVDGASSASSGIGIHIRIQHTKEALEGALVDAIETALKDNYPCIYIHQSPKITSDRTERKRKGIQDWMKSLSLYQFEFDADSIVNSLEPEQVELVLKLIAESFHHGAESVRKWNRERKERENNSQTKGA